MTPCRASDSRPMRPSKLKSTDWVPPDVGTRPWRKSWYSGRRAVDARSLCHSRMWWRRSSDRSYCVTSRQLWSSNKRGLAWRQAWKYDVAVLWAPRWRKTSFTMTSPTLGSSRQAEPRAPPGASEAYGLIMAVRPRPDRVGQAMAREVHHQ